MSKKKFAVQVREVHTIWYEVEAEDELEAIGTAQRMVGGEVDRPLPIRPETEFQHVDWHSGMSLEKLGVAPKEARDKGIMVHLGPPLDGYNYVLHVSNVVPREEYDEHYGSDVA